MSSNSDNDYIFSLLLGEINKKLTLHPAENNELPDLIISLLENRDSSDKVKEEINKKILQKLTDIYNEDKERFWKIINDMSETDEKTLSELLKKK